MEINDFNLSLNNLMLKIDLSMLLLDSKLQKQLKKRDMIKQMIQQTVDSKKYEISLRDTRQKINIIENITKEITVIKKALSKTYIYAQGLVNEHLEIEQLNKELDDIDLIAYKLQIDEIVGEI